VELMAWPKPSMKIICAPQPNKTGETTNPFLHPSHLRNRPRHFAVESDHSHSKKSLCSFFLDAFHICSLGPTNESNNSKS